MMHHLGGDGKSLLYFIETFMKCLAGIGCDYEPFRAIAPEDLPQGSSMPFIYKVLCNSWNKSWQKDKKIFGFDDLDASHEKYWKDHGSSIEITEYSDRIRRLQDL